ncbi:hypothetical protein BTR22_07720 [Alkalihalophilus pseudofirmus]|uniref:hypothetical protein n=1 Tax=Alkalihalophilus pseudofirmus TaxID=79885 RepID=UPI00095258B2|nr:hypothetical protein BTR22_07720 [Alkalihalophilus pseudofirmus]
MKLFARVVIMIYFFLVMYPANGVAGQIDLESISIKPLYRSLPIEVISGSSEPQISLSYSLRENDVFIDCVIRGVVVTEEKEGALHQDAEGHYRLYINDEHASTLFTNSFVIEGLPRGEHTIRVVLVKNDRTPYGSEDSVTITL